MKKDGMNPKDCAFFDTKNPGCPITSWIKDRPNTSKTQLLKDYPWCLKCYRTQKGKTTLDLGAIRISSTKIITRQMIRSLAKCLKKNQDAAKTDHWM